MCGFHFSKKYFHKSKLMVDWYLSLGIKKYKKKPQNPPNKQTNKQETMEENNNKIFSLLVESNLISDWLSLRLSISHTHIFLTCSFSNVIFFLYQFKKKTPTIHRIRLLLYPWICIFPMSSYINCYFMVKHVWNSMSLFYWNFLL